MCCDFDLLSSFLQLVESKKVNPSSIWFLTLEPCSVVIQEMLHHIRNSCRRRGILGGGAFGITRGNFGLSSQLFLEMFYCGGSNCFEGVHRVATWFRAWFRLCAGESLSPCFSPYCCWSGPFVSLSPLCLLSSVIQLLWVCLCPYLRLSVLHICFPSFVGWEG